MIWRQVGDARIVTWVNGRVRDSSASANSKVLFDFKASIVRLPIASPSPKYYDRFSVVIKLTSSMPASAESRNAFWHLLDPFQQGWLGGARTHDDIASPSVVFDFWPGWIKRHLVRIALHGDMPAVPSSFLRTYGFNDALGAKIRRPRFGQSWSSFSWRRWTEHIRSPFLAIAGAAACNSPY
jgi:hypothetical protein